MARLRRSFDTEFKREAANLVLRDGYSIAEACRSLDIGGQQIASIVVEQWIQTHNLLSC